MTKTMGINELISKLKEYDAKSTVKVWSNGADNAYPISNVAAGTTCAYIGVDDRNLVDLSKIWHDANEEPDGDKWKILCVDVYNGCWVENRINAFFLHNRWNEYAEVELVKTWAYISDLLPKGGEK